MPIDTIYMPQDLYLPSHYLQRQWKLRKAVRSPPDCVLPLLTVASAPSSMGFAAKSSSDPEGTTHFQMLPLWLLINTPVAHLCLLQVVVSLCSATVRELLVASSATTVMDPFATGTCCITRQAPQRRSHRKRSRCQ